jgi:NADH:ubiquinone oxidoreductase subunit 3 (subunit A)
MLLAISTFKLACIIMMALLIMAAFLFFALLLRGGRTQEDEDMPGCDYDYGEPPYNSYKYN